MEMLTMKHWKCPGIRVTLGDLQGDQSEEITK
jgi:hypothetical protein